jgi:hypothetical protein
MMSMGRRYDQRRSRGWAREAGIDRMDNLVFSCFVRLEGIPHARFFNRATWEPVTLSRADCVARLNLILGA